MSEDPYKTPDSDLGNEQGERSRPVWVWIILVLTGFGVLGVLIHILIAAGAMPLDEMTAQYYNNLSPLDHILNTAGPLLAFLASIYLFKLKRTALKLWVAYGVLYGLTLLKFSMSENWHTFQVESGNPTALTISFGIFTTFAIIFYAYRLDSKGFLK